MGRPIRIFLALVVLLAALFVAGRYYGLLWPDHGPLGDQRGDFGGGPGRTGGWAVLSYRLLTEDLDKPVELRSAVLVGADPALEVMEMRFVPCPTGSEKCIPGIIGERWPLGVETERIPGAVLSAEGTPTIAVALRLPSRPGNYRVRGLELHYSEGWRRFRTEVGPEVTIEAR